MKSPLLLKQQVTGIVDDLLLKSLDEQGVIPFPRVFNDTSSKLAVNIGNFEKDGSRLALSGDACYMKITFFWFYLQNLSDLKLILYIKSPGINSLGREQISNPLFLSEELTSFIKDKIPFSIVVSPEFKKYVENGHQSDDLMYARKQTCIARWTLIVAIFALLVSVAAVFLSCFSMQMAQYL